MEELSDHWWCNRCGLSWTKPDTKFGELRVVSGGRSTGLTAGKTRIRAKQNLLRMEDETSG